mmetsp:Transcript_6440/g.15166  ORF Transcript_6440/g.15166 Transcript_6440/m.15166 type:complete len:270 (+) Transcript_6440:499-1308(+)
MPSRGEGLQAIGYLQSSPIKPGGASISSTTSQVFMIGNTARTSPLSGKSIMPTAMSKLSQDPTLLNRTSWTRKELLKVNRSVRKGETRLLKRGEFDPAAHRSGPPRPTRSQLQCPHAAHVAKLALPVPLFRGIRERGQPSDVPLLTRAANDPSETWQELMRGNPVRQVFDHESGTVVSASFGGGEGDGGGSLAGSDSGSSAETEAAKSPEAARQDRQQQQHQHQHQHTRKARKGLQETNGIGHVFNLLAQERGYGTGEWFADRPGRSKK